jgi:NAD(P)-dependent dehydrogenase (short-subunit alcohol dehydrogenase family)
MHTDSPPDLAGRTFMVTGATSGLGRVTSLRLAARGAHLVLACRSAPRAGEVVDEVAATTPGSAVHVPLDLADLASVRACADAVAARGEPVHVLVNNAGVAGSRGVTEQGFELAFGVNHLGHFLLATRLLDTLGPDAPGRVVSLASKAHFGAKAIDWEALQRPTRTRTGLVEYQVAKLCNVLFAQELARRCPGVESVAVHPGVVATDIWRSVPWPVRPIMTRFMRSTDEGAEAPLHWATIPAVSPSGAYADGTTVTAPAEIATPELAADLWRHSEGWAG